MRERKKKKIIILSMIGLLFLMVSGYAAFQTNLDIEGTSSINSNWDIRITNVTESNKNGEGETVSTNFTNLTAYMEANLYNKGDFVEYDVTIENKGTFDASLSDIITNVKSNNDAVKITFSGYTKGETLYKDTQKIIKVKIEYNPDYEGDGEGSGEVEVEFTYDQAEGGTIVPTNKYLVTYDCITNGGSDCTSYNEYLSEGSSINLTYQGTDKKYYEFVGWNTDSKATSGLTSLNMGSNDITLYAIYQIKDTTPPIIDSINTSSTTNSITVVVNAHDDESEIIKYEYSKDGGRTWETSSNNTYTFRDLQSNTSYNIKVRVTNAVDLNAEKDAMASSDITDNVVTDGDGLYADEYEKDRYVYKGKDPNNYIEFNDELWRIVSKESDGTYKIVRNDLLDIQTWNETVSNVWSASSLKTYLNETYYDSLSEEARDYIKIHDWAAGAIINDNNDLSAQIKDEKGTMDSGKVGLISASDYLKANTNKNSCGTFSLNNSNYTTCANTTWLISDSNYWLITPAGDYATSAYSIIATGSLYNTNVRMYNSPRPAVYLIPDIALKGEGTKGNPYKIVTIGVSTETLEKPTFTEKETEDGKDVTIHYPEGCGDNLTCSYIKNSGEEVEVKESTAIVSFAESGNLVAKVTDGTNSVNSSLSVVIETGIDITEDIVTSGDGLYEDEYEDGRYVYKGKEPNNYIEFNDELWRIVSKESDGTYKIVRNEVLEDQPWNTSSRNTWSSSSLYNYLNNDYYNTISSEYQGYIENHNWAAGSVTMNNDDMASQIKSEQGTTVQNNVGLLTHSDYLRANSNKAQCGTDKVNFSNYRTCINTDWMYISGNTWWTISPSSANTTTSWQVTGSGDINVYTVTNNRGVRPAVYLNKDVKLTGEGTKSNPYKIKGSGGSSEPAENLTLSLSSSSTTNSITVVANATADSGIAKYEYRLNNNSWNTAYSNSYTFNNLEDNTSYDFSVRITSNDGNQKTETSSAKTKIIDVPTFRESTTSSGKDVTITYPSGCGSTYTCTYSKNGASDVTVRSTSATVSFTASGNLVAKVSDGTNEVSSSHEVTIATEKSNVIQSWTASSSTDFHASTYRPNIITATFTDNTNVPSNAVASWDVSAAQDEGVMAWVVRSSSDSSKYDLYIGADGGVVANQNSSYLFMSFTNLQTITFGDNFDTSKVTNMMGMFHSCESLTELDLSNFDTSNVTTMSNMFGGKYYENSEISENLKTLDLSSFDTSNVTDMSYMFFGRDALEEIIFGDNFDTSNVTSMDSMFEGCKSLTELNLCQFDTTNVTNMTKMFRYTLNLQAVYVGPNWTTPNADTTNMFSNSGISSVTKSDNCEVASDNVTLSLLSTSTTNSITVVANASANSGINKYEYRINSGSWTSKSSNTHTFTGLNDNTSYKVEVRVTSKNGNQTTKSSTVWTKSIDVPTFSETETSNGKNVTITYPSGCGSTYTCTYSKNGAGFTTVYSSKATVSFTTSGDLVARVSDGNNTVSSSHTVTIEAQTITTDDLKDLVVNSGDGLYQDSYENGRYIYKGADPDNYITFSGETWRIISVENDGTLKIMRNDSIGSRAWDTTGGTYGSNNWARPADLNTYLNEEYLSTLSDSDKVVSHNFSIGAVTFKNNDLADQITDENGTTWNGKVGLITVSEYLRANTNTEQCGTFSLNNSNDSTCKTTDWMYSAGPKSFYIWTISPSASNSHSVFALDVTVSMGGSVSYNSAYYTSRVVPALYLTSSIQLSGEGTESNPYVITN